MRFSRLMIANRGEIAIRVMRSAGELGIATAAVYSEDDADSLHTQKADAAFQLEGKGAGAYLDIDQIIEVAKDNRCDAIHPGYGFLSENPRLARECQEAGINLVGPGAPVLELFGDKANARSYASALGVPVLEGTVKATTYAEAKSFMTSLDKGAQLMIKAMHGGGGRGIRVVTDPNDLEEALNRCQSEANSTFGSMDVYVEEYLPEARHIEVQIVGDGNSVIHLGERDCSIQRRHQKILELAPAPGIDPDLLKQIHKAATDLAASVNYRSLGTFEFLVNTVNSRFAFIEANPRLQVEHTVTEEVTGYDLVAIQLRLAGGETLEQLGLEYAPSGFAIQARVNMETMKDDGSTVPSGGQLKVFDPPSGPGIRTDSYGYTGYRTNPSFDSLLAKIIAHKPGGSFNEVVNRIYRALSEFRIDGVQTNVSFLQSILKHSALQKTEFHTQFIEQRLAELLANCADHQRHYFQSEAAAQPTHAGAKIDPNDPLAVLTFGQAGSSVNTPAPTETIPVAADYVTPDGTVALLAPMQGTIISIEVSEGDEVGAGSTLLIMDSMKMEHEIKAEISGIVRQIEVQMSDTIYTGHPLLFMEETEISETDEAAAAEIDLDAVRPDLKAILDRRGLTEDDARPKAVARRRATSQRTARENVYDLCESGTFVEYGPLVLAAQRRRRSIPELIEKSPADGMITGVGAINQDLFGDPACRCVVMSYDYTVFAGTQGAHNHNKTDRMIDVATQGRMPMVLFAEGGGGRPGDTEGGGGGRTFSRFATLSGLVPMVGITSGRCFAGNASLLGCCDVIIATANANIGMGGPAMIEGGGLGIFTPEDIGPMSIQVPSGVVDIAVEDEREAVQVAKKYLSYFQGSLDRWQEPDQRVMRRIVPENRLRVYDVRKVIETLADTDTVLEIRKDFGVGMLTSLVRVDGKPLGVIANNPMHLGGAIDSDGSDKGARFMQLCDAFDIPSLFLCDTPGIMVGPEIERTALVRHSSRMFLIGANLSVPFFTVVLRKSYGLGGIAMAGGSFKAPMFSTSWPTGEFGGMGLEGSVKLGYREDLAAIEDAEERKARYEEMVARAYENGKALNNASLFGVDDAIDPAETRWWVASLLKSVKPPAPRVGKKRPVVDAW